ncbi:diaminopimelate decarboxylase [Virgibacillus pantothenticus]|uniref:Diaminopimelate decarboxylase n=1 Tax=Virgibacillus pantothenticus TaxID=1473 RepID=A0A0L0QP62_VIRPA|nr:diaminopimelate decarboxylase [Virgibacillus pantothenticus]KNE20415.1 diaminopimelate decarboxylase [Virgibacillus pantothenticus]MBU8565435.1 diaminopimelate decarboxylase [Virgibacillus pantothenticus]MBU8599735.1 diaminopimelate decarboxylase [Virgibacillus pantothenticus]MBU8634182.1 diaminopimelate decarboxylase [Virgibacillus pantothenticus]MBU8641476.1 diaminopimelate decarboxylase [Virgibacillus pantothenticus]
MIIDNHPFTVNEQGHLEIGGLDSVTLAKKYGTPLYVYDVQMIRDNCRAFVNTFQNMGVTAKVAYASKAFSSIAMVQVIKQEGMYLDVVSEGELYTALHAGYPTEKIHFHGNNKSIAELRMAIEHNIGCIVVDNFQEIKHIRSLLKTYDKQMDVLMRVTPGIESKTHHYIMTGNEDSKFGFNLQNGQAETAFLQMHNDPYIRFQGLHCHIGSQIFETDRFILATSVLFQELRTWKERHGYTPNVLNLGGGYGIRYTKDDAPISYAPFVEELVNEVQKQVEALAIPMPEIWLEPGRAIAGNAGITLYTVGAMKEIPGIRNYVAVDGGMTDNLRPALYQAKYEAVLANKAAAPTETNVSIAGKCCESGDMLIWDLPLPHVSQNDILAVFSTGAYGYSMANHYNRFAKPAVVFVENGEDKLVVQRETYQDIIRHDLSYE